MSKKDELPPLVAAAVALDTELKKYAEIAATVAKAPLDSQKAIDRVTRAVADAVESEKKVLDGVKALVDAVHAARDAQGEATAQINERGAAIAQKRTELELLLVRFKNIGMVGKALNEAIAKIAEYKPDPYDAEAAQQVDDTLAKIEEGMTECAKHAGEVQSDAQKQGFDDVARQADQMRQQILSTKNRVALLRKQLQAR